MMPQNVQDALQFQLKLSSIFSSQGTDRRFPSTVRDVHKLELGTPRQTRRHCPSQGAM